MKDFVFNNTSLAEAVNQRVLGSSPRGGAAIQAGILPAFFLFQILGSRLRTGWPLHYKKSTGPLTVARPGLRINREVLKIKSLHKIIPFSSSIKKRTHVIRATY